MYVGMSVLTLESQIILWLGGVRWCVFCLDDVHITLEHELVYLRALVYLCAFIRMPVRVRSVKSAVLWV